MIIMMIMMMMIAPHLHLALLLASVVAAGVVVSVVVVVPARHDGDGRLLADGPVLAVAGLLLHLVVLQPLMGGGSQAVASLEVTLALRSLPSL